MDGHYHATVARQLEAIESACSDGRPTYLWKISNLLAYLVFSCETPFFDCQEVICGITVSKTDIVPVWPSGKARVRKTLFCWFDSNRWLKVKILQLSRLTARVCLKQKKNQPAVKLIGSLWGFGWLLARLLKRDSAMCVLSRSFSAVIPL